MCGFILPAPHTNPHIHEPSWKSAHIFEHQPQRKPMTGSEDKLMDISASRLLEESTFSQGNRLRRLIPPPARSMRKQREDSLPRLRDKPNAAVFLSLPFRRSWKQIDLL